MRGSIASKRAPTIALTLVCWAGCAFDAPSSDREPDEMPEASRPITAMEETGPIAEAWLERAKIESTFTLEEGLLTSPPLDLPAPASRASIWIREASGPVGVEVQAGWANGQVGPWISLSEVWSEKGQRVLAVDLDTAATRLRFRLSPEAVPGIRGVFWTTSVPLAPEVRSGELPDPEVALGSPVRPRSDWSARAARCGRTSMQRTVRLRRFPAPAATEDVQVFLRAAQAFDQEGRLWCDVRASYLAGDQLWMGRGPRESALAPDEVDVVVLGCASSEGARSTLTALLDQLTEELSLTSPSQLSVDASPVCPADTWVEQALDDWLATAPFGVEPPPPPPPPPAEEGHVLGTVLDDVTSAALSGVTARCDCGPMAMTDAAGAFELRLPSGAHTITFEKDGYDPGTETVSIAEGSETVLSVRLQPIDAPDPLVSVIDHSFLIQRFGGNDVDPFDYPETQDGFQQYLDAVGVTHFAAWEYVIPNNPTVAAGCGYTILLPDRSWWRKGAALGLLADQLRALVNEPVNLRNWWRPDCYNNGVGGAPGGDHPDADALDLDFASERSRADAQRYLCDEYWLQDIVAPEEIAPGSNLNPRLNMSVGLGAITIHVGLLSSNGRRFWKYDSYTTLTNSGTCW